MKITPPTIWSSERWYAIIDAAAKNMHADGITECSPSQIIEYWQRVLPSVTPYESGSVDFNRRRFTITRQMQRTKQRLWAYNNPQPNYKMAYASELAARKKMRSYNERLPRCLQDRNLELRRARYKLSTMQDNGQ